MSQLSILPDPEVVRIADGYYEFLSDGEMVYDFKPNDTGDCLRWVEHLAQKSWVTKQHLEQFARLAATAFNVGYR